MIIYVKGDLFDTDADIIAHGCNCVGGYGSGVAKTMGEQYPKARKAYYEKFNGEGWTLGDVQFVYCPGKIIANSATQHAYLPRGRCHADYPAIEKAMKLVKDFAKQNNMSVAIPKIGAGLAGGDWNKIEGILKKIFTDHDITVYVLGN